MDVHGLLIDMDGTVYQGDCLVSGVPDAIAGLRSRGIPFLFSTSTWEDFEGFAITQTDSDAVVVGDMGECFSFDVLNSAFRSLREGACLVAVHKNRFWIPEDGPTLDAGPFVAALEYAAQVTATLVGKPAPAFFESAAARLGLDPVRLAVVGDDIHSDIAGGNRAGMSTVLVCTGKFDAEAFEQADTDFRPSLVASSLPVAIKELFPG